MPQISAEFVLQLATKTHRADGEVLQVAEKQGGVPKIVRKTSNTSNIQKRRAKFKTKQTGIKTGHQEKVFCCAG
jgi:hypothetical protein